MNGGDFIKNSIFNIFGTKQSCSNDETLTKSKSLAVMYLNKTKNELLDELGIYGQDEEFNIKFDIKCIEDVITYLQK